MPGFAGRGVGCGEGCEVVGVLTAWTLVFCPSALAGMGVGGLESGGLKAQTLGFSPCSWEVVGGWGWPECTLQPSLPFVGSFSPNC